MIDTVVTWLIVVLIAGICGSFYRLFVGPTVIDRLLAFDCIAISAVGILALISLLWKTTIFLELILVYSVLGFVGMVAMVFYLYRTIPVRKGDGEEGGP